MLQVLLPLLARSSYIFSHCWRNSENTYFSFSRPLVQQQWLHSLRASPELDHSYVFAILFHPLPFFSRVSLFNNPRHLLLILRSSRPFSNDDHIENCDSIADYSDQNSSLLTRARSVNETDWIMKSSFSGSLTETKIEFRLK